jgi:hypothetical protein
MPLVPRNKLPVPFAASQCDEIVELFQNLGRSSVWDLVDKVNFEGNTYEPEGMVRIGETDSLSVPENTLPLLFRTEITQSSMVLTELPVQGLHALLSLLATVLILQTQL